MMEKDLWILQNSIENNENYISKLFNKFKINYNFAHDKNGLSVYFSYKLSRYKAHIDYESMSLILMEKNKVNNYKNKEFYHYYMEFKQDVWFEMLKVLVEEK